MARATCDNPRRSAVLRTADLPCRAITPGPTKLRGQLPKSGALLALTKGIKGWFHDMTVPLGGLQTSDADQAQRAMEIG